MWELEFLRFTELKDGDLSIIKELPQLKEVIFHPNKKHDTHTKEEIAQILLGKGSKK